MNQLPREILQMIEDAVDKVLSPAGGEDLSPVKARCRRHGWALSRQEERLLARIADSYIDALRV
jgi:hypothetical protein